MSCSLSRSLASRSSESSPSHPLLKWLIDFVVNFVVNFVDVPLPLNLTSIQRRTQVRRYGIETAR